MRAPHSGLRTDVARGARATQVERRIGGGALLAACCASWIDDQNRAATLVLEGSQGQHPDMATARSSFRHRRFVWGTGRSVLDRVPSSFLPPLPQQV